METDEIRLCLDDARRACAEGREFAGGITAESRFAARQTTALMRLIEAIESLLAEREAFAGRLRRTSAPRVITAPPPIVPPPQPDSPAETTTP